MFFYIARQPILNRDKSLFAYELLFRNGMKNAFPDVSAEAATASLIENSQFQTSVTEITDQQLAFINFSEIAILQDLPALMPKQSIVVEILETVHPSEPVFAALRSLKARGYTLALDDFDFNPEWHNILDVIDIIKVDLSVSTDEQISQLFGVAKQFDIRLLAERVETHEQFQACYEKGFQYFQGYFFARPEIVQKRALSPNQLVYTQLLHACAQPEMDFDSVSELMSQDVGLTYKLLRYVNSPACTMGKKIETLKQAIVFLGEAQIKKFTAVIAAAQLGAHKPSELVRLSVVRARMCELIANECRVNIEAEKAFLTGMFSVLDAILDEEFVTIMSRIEISADVQEALIERKGALAYCLAIIQFYEKANWEKVSTLSARLGIDENAIPTLYLDALNWANALSDPAS